MPEEQTLKGYKTILTKQERSWLQHHQQLSEHQD